MTFVGGLTDSGLGTSQLPQAGGSSISHTGTVPIESEAPDLGNLDYTSGDARVLILTCPSITLLLSLILGSTTWSSVCPYEQILWHLSLTLMLMDNARIFNQTLWCKSPMKMTWWSHPSPQARDDQAFPQCSAEFNDWGLWDATWWYWGSLQSISCLGPGRSITSSQVSEALY